MEDTPNKNDLLFQNLCMIFETAAMQNMGKLKNPVTGTVEKDLIQASYAIDMLDMIHAKTAGNRSDQETRLLETLLSGLKLTYVDELKRSEKESESGSAPEPEKPSEE